MMTLLRSVLGSVRPVTPTRQQSKRLTAVAANPRIATCEDVETLVRAHGVPETKVWAVVDRLARGTVDPSLAWTWALEHDGTELAEVCDAPVSDRELVAYMAVGPGAFSRRVGAR